MNSSSRDSFHASYEKPDSIQGLSILRADIHSRTISPKRPPIVSESENFHPNKPHNTNPATPVNGGSASTQRRETHMNSASSNDDTTVDRTPNVANESQYWSTFTPSSAIRIGLPETLDRLQSIKSMSPVDAHEIAWQMRQVIPCMLLLHLPNSPGLEIVTFLFFTLSL